MLPKVPSEQVSNAFLTMLQRHRGGGLLNQASIDLARIVEAVQSTGKGGKLAIVIEVKPAKKGSNALVITDDVKPTIPEEETDASFWFASADGVLSKSPVEQQELPLSVVPTTRNETAPEEGMPTTEAFIRKIQQVAG